MEDLETLQKKLSFLKYILKINLVKITILLKMLNLIQIKKIFINQIVILK